MYHKQKAITIPASTVNISFQELVSAPNSIGLPQGSPQGLRGPLQGASGSQVPLLFEEKENQPKLLLAVIH